MAICGPAARLALGQQRFEPLALGRAQEPA